MDKTIGLGPGDVPITIAGKDYVLKPTLYAAQTLSRMGGGVRGVSQKLMDLDHDMIVTVIMIGLGYGATRKPPKDLEEQIWKAGLTTLAAPCGRYVTSIANGGKIPKELADEGAEDGGDGDDSDVVRVEEGSGEQPKNPTTAPS